MITINSENYKVDNGKVLLGYVGETNARTITVNHPVIWEVSDYRIRFEYSDGVVYEVPIRNNELTITGSLLREVGEVNMQWLAVKPDGDSYELVAKSNIFKGIIRPSISDDIAPVPTYEQSRTVLENVLEADREIANKVAAAEAAKSAAVTAELAVQEFADNISDNAEAIEDNIELANHKLIQINALAQTAEADLEQVVEAVEDVQDAVTQVQQNTADIMVLKPDTVNAKTALFGSAKLTKLLKTAASNSSTRITSNGTLEILQGYRVFIFNVADYDSVAVVNELDSYLAFYNTATPISNNQISSESVVSVKTVTANIKATFDIPEGAVSFGVTVVHNAVNANATVVGIKDNANKDGIADLSDMTENLINPELVQDGDYQGYKRTGNIEVEPDTTYVVSRHALLLSSINPHVNYKCQFLDENLNIISSIETNPFTTPANCKYIYLTSKSPYYFDNYKLEKGSTYTGYVPYGLKQSYPEYYNSPFKDKKLCAVGDSITAGQTSYVRGLVLKTGMAVIAEQYDENTPTAIPGSCVSKYGNNDTTREDYMCSDGRIANIPQDSEVILIMGGSNDYAATIGTLDGEHDETTFYGAYQLMLDKIYARCPNADVFICEMPFAHIQIGTHFEQRQQAIRDIAYKYGYPLLNTRAEGVNELNYTLYRQDGTHPNEAGKERLASLLSAQMVSYRR